MSVFIIPRCLLPFVLVSVIGGQSLAKGGNVRNEDYYDPAHLNKLPPEVRRAVRGNFCRVVTSACSSGTFGNFWHSRLETANLSHLNHLSTFPGQPCEVREAVFRQCSTARAMHPFAEYKDNLQKLVLHYEHFYCSTGGTYCSRTGCLHEVYGTSNGHYRLIRSYYAPEGQ